MEGRNLSLKESMTLLRVEGSHAGVMMPYSSWKGMF